MNFRLALILGLLFAVCVSLSNAEDEGAKSEPEPEGEPEGSPKEEDSKGAGDSVGKPGESKGPFHMIILCNFSTHLKSNKVILILLSFVYSWKQQSCGSSTGVPGFSHLRNGPCCKVHSLKIIEWHILQNLSCFFKVLFWVSILL